MIKEIIRKNFTRVSSGVYVTTERERDSLYAITTHPRCMKLKKKQDNYVLEDKNLLRLRESTKKGYKECDEGDGVGLSRSHCTYRRGVSHKDSTGALNTQEGSWGVVMKNNDDAMINDEYEGYRIRKLTPVECERLQSFPDGWTEYGKDGERISDTQRYKCLGNAVTTNVVTYVINQMFMNHDTDNADGDGDNGEG